MIQAQLKLKLTPRQERQLDHWLRRLAGVWNWSIRKIENDAQGGVYHTSFGLCALLNGHGRKIGVAQDAINGTVNTARVSWNRCLKGITRKPRLKGQHNRLNSVAFAHGDRIAIYGNRVAVPGLGRVRFYKQAVPLGRTRQARIVRRSSGWYLCLFIDAEPHTIPRIASGQIGIDPGFKNLLTLSSGEKIPHPRELEASALRLAQAQRGGGKSLTARIHERIGNQRKDRNHKLSRRLVSENVFIAFSKDRIKGIARRFGKSVASSGHAQLRQMISYKSPTSGTEYVEPESRNSTRRCSACGALSGPTGLASLSVRHWVCSCGAEHDRDQNAGMNALNDGLGMSHERQAIAA